jgi:tyrosyl-tRNA synthetase
MGKSEGNMVSLLDTPNDMYGKIMSWTDALIVNAFELCTDYTMSQVDQIEKELAGGANPRDSKMRLAYEIVRVCHGEKEAQKAQEVFVGTFQKKELPNDVITISQKSATSLIGCFLEKNIVVSNGEARRLADAGAIVHLETEKRISFEDAKKVPEIGTYKIGKNRFIKIV